MKHDLHYDLSIILPLYKPKSDWAAALIGNIQEVTNALPTVRIQFIIVNDGFETSSNLDIFDLLSEAYGNLFFISYSNNMGKGYALRTGVNAAEAPLVITTDFDFPYTTSNIVEVYHSLVKGADVVAGKRCNQYYLNLPLRRKLISKSCMLLNWLLLNLPDCDTQSGLKGFNERGKKLFLSTKVNRFLVDTEFLVLAYKRRLLVSIIELQLKPAIRFSSMSIKILFTEMKNLAFIVNINGLLEGSTMPKYHAVAKNLPDLRFGRV